MGRNAARTIVTLMLTFFLISLGTIAEAKKYGEVDAKTTKDMMEKENTLVVFPLSAIEFGDLHIKGSVNISMDLLAEKLPKDKSQKIIFYCLGVKCVASWRAAEKAVSLGYKNVFAFREGLPGWTAAGYPTVSIEKLPDVKIKTMTTSELSGQLDNNLVVLLDVNLNDDAHKFYIDSSQRVHIPLDVLHLKVATLNKSDAIAVLCLKGKRSPTAARYLIGQGFENVTVVDGGIQKWVMEGRPVKQGS
jgi:rhodanese-related sulfurtransferase